MVTFFHKDKHSEPQAKKQQPQSAPRKEEIKQAVAAEFQEFGPPIEELPIELEERPAPSAPLFVKVEKYRDVLANVQEMKLFVSSVKDIFTLMQEVEHIRADALNVMKVTVQRLEKAVVELDTELLRPKGISTGSTFGASDVHHIESSLSELQDQLLELRKELQGIR